MKKLLLLFSFFLSLASFSQVIATANFESLTVGNIGTDLTGTTAGQGGWFTYNSAGGTNNDNTNYQIIDQAGNKKFQITGSNSTTGTKYMWQDGFDAAWAARTVGNNIVEVEIDLYASATATTSLNTARLALWNTAQDKVLGGFVYYPTSRIIKGYGSSGTSTYVFTLGTADIVLAAGTWNRIGFSWNSVTGEIKWKGPGFNGYYVATNGGQTPAELDFLATTTTGNTVAASTLFDNLIIRASAADTLLGINENILLAEFNIFPNPAKEMIYLSSSKYTYNSVKITDLNGRVVKSIDYNNVNESSIDISNLVTGMYLMNVVTDQGAFTQKIIKE